MNLTVCQLSFVINKKNIYQQKRQRNQSFEQKHVIHQIRRRHLKSDIQKDHTTCHHYQSGPYYQSVFVSRRQRLNYPKPEKKRIIIKNGYNFNIMKRNRPQISRQFSNYCNNITETNYLTKTGPAGGFFFEVRRCHPAAASGPLQSGGRAPPRTPRPPLPPPRSPPSPPTIAFYADICHNTAN